ncbi:MAG: T9SS C-terminal target domain-containing protein, partial [Bacteroidetes bacterium]
DNDATTSFFFSENVYSKAGWDPDNNRPSRTNAYTISGGGNIEFLSGFSIPNGQGMVIDSVQFYVAIGNGLTLGDIQGSVGAFIYEWVDANSDGGVGTDELSLVAITDVTFPDPASTGDWVKVPVLDFNTFEEGLAVSGDGATYFVGTRYEGSELVFMGFDENFDQTLWSTFIAQSDLELPYIGVQGWVNNIPDVDNGFIFTGFFGSAATAVIVNSANSAEDVEIVSNMSMFPNPTSDRLTVEVELPELTSTLEYKIQSASGIVVRQEKRSNVNYDKADFDVSDLPSGQYFLILKTDNGSAARAFTVQH